MTMAERIRIKKGDAVKVLTGKDRGKTGRYIIILMDITGRFTVPYWLITITRKSPE